MVAKVSRCCCLQEGVTRYETLVASHQAYSDAYAQCRDWLRTHVDKLDFCTEPCSDKIAISSKLDRLKVRLHRAVQR